MNKKEFINIDTSLEYIICSPLGTYPKKSVKQGFSGLYVNDGVISLAYLAHKPWQKEKLITALFASTNFKKGFLKLYFLPFSHVCDIQDEALVDVKLAEDISSKKQEKYIAKGEIFPEFDQYENAKGASLPVILGGVPYHQVDDLICVETFKAVMDTLENVRYDGLFEIIELLQESSQLSCHLQFQVQANHYLLLALEQLDKASWSKEHPYLKEWLAKDFSAGFFEMAKNINPIEYVKLFKAVVTNVKNSLLI